MITATDYTGICFHCKRKLRTVQEEIQGYCDECYEKYLDEINAIYESDYK